MLLVLLLSLTLAIQLGRRNFFAEEVPPALSVVLPVGIVIRLGEAFPAQGIYQFPDGSTPRDVIRLTLGPKRLPASSGEEWDVPLQTGESLDLVPAVGGAVSLHRKMLPAKQRILLGLPLHPDQMTQEDWQALPGLGPKLAELIERDRQENGDFGSLLGLSRVKGIGPLKIKSWEKFFIATPMPL